MIIKVIFCENKNESVCFAHEIILLGLFTFFLQCDWCYQKLFL